VPFGYDSGFDVATLDTLTTAGVTGSQKATGVNLCFQVTVADVGANVVVRFEGSLDDNNYFNIDASAADTTITANGTTGYFMQAPVQFVRLRLVSLSGGTPSVSCKIGCI